MSEQKLTPWFDAAVPPWEPGVYEMQVGTGRCFAYWNGTRFGYRTFTVRHPTEEDVREAVSDAFLLRNAETCLPETSIWRGLSTPPKESP
jgi:hypothetical protein